MDLTLDQALQKGIEAHKAGQVQEADRLYTAILKAQPKHPDTNHNMGVLAVGVGNFQESLPFFKTALEANPNTVQFWLSYIDALVKLDRLDDAKCIFNQARNKGAKGDGFDKLEQRLKASKVQEPPQGQLQSLINLYSQGRLQQAIEQAQVLTKQYPEAFEIWNIMGASAAQIGQLDQAIIAFQKVIALKPDYAEAQYNIGNALKEQGKLEEAIEAYNKALVIKPDYAYAYNNTGLTLQNQGKLDEAIGAFNKAVTIKPDYANAHLNKGNVLKEQGKLEEAIEAYKKVLAIKPDYAEAFNNMGTSLQEQGKLEEAIEAYNMAIAIRPDYADAFNNMGVSLKEQGKLEEAIETYSKALTIKPDYAEAHNNMGNALKEQSKLEKTIEAYNKAIAIRPDYAEAYNNMGIALQEQGKLGEAIGSYKKALTMKPDYAEAYNNMGVVLQEQSKLDEALEAFNKALVIKPNNAEAHNNMGNALKKVIFNKPNSGLQKVVTAILERKTDVRPADISSAAISLLKFEPVLQKVLQRQSKGQLIQFLNEAVLNLSELPLLLKLMSICPLADLELEKSLTDIRSCLLLSVSQLTASPEVLRFQSALALQCFTNEYVYDLSDLENKAFQALEVLVTKMLGKGQQPNPHSVLCLASYRALHEYDWCNLLTITNDIEEVFTRQVMEPKQEARMKPDIPALEEITDKVSSKVRDQYEESPYPRWVNLGLSFKSLSISEVSDKRELRLFDNTINKVTAPNILIAGCGTGQDSISTAARFQNSKVLAIDLSLSSLAYAKRKTEELGIQNIEYMQADILDLDKLDRQFDIVESAGVLHHMDDPMAGWRVLTDCLKPGGLMKIGLYSELARQHIVEMREEINQGGSGSSDLAMKSFRNGVINSNKDHHKKILNSADFYSISTLRDLLFHVQEHRFTIPQIKDCLRELGLKFCGFEADRLVQNFKLNNTAVDDPYDLDNWNSYEIANPNTFGAMYQFWCQKVA